MIYKTRPTINSVVASFNEVLTGIENAALQVTVGSKQVSDSSQQLSQGAAEQASSVEELTASIDLISSQTKKNAANAAQASKLSMEIENGAEDGNEQMTQMLTSMNEIGEASQNIFKIIKVIDDIAFQTNILALNAAVEAARAGQYGKGFAVVAEEVRNLAAKSAQAANETTGLIENSNMKVEVGIKIANDMAEKLQHIAQNIKKSTTFANDISVASSEQASEIIQIDKGIQQVSAVVQTNSATSEQSAASSEELSGQALNLMKMVERFNLGTSATTQDSSVEQKYTQPYSTKVSSDAGKVDSAKSKPDMRAINTPKGKPEILLDGNYGKY